ncbi:MAG: hypothetical protein A3K19_29315 [Lentisphaerae bacterium RIFOXYB12_FULL_65_16]|nr:MAG: hypothetical protein A3K18_13330 [Lentisphaerae bacterium RIFOXYA12_64_32]OGV88398.1 MAG: hypothetical protein A3K19_29315 [Lentisphaerae bacterium RIFOXYB12_FULL_65_16]
MWKKLAPLLIVLSVTLNVAVAGFWGARCWRSTCAVSGSCGQAEVGCPLHRRLGASEEQWRRIEPVVTAFRQESRTVCQEVAQARLELLELLAAPKPDTETIAAKQEEILAGQRRVQELVIKYILREKEILTPEQCRALFDLLRQRNDCAGHGPMLGTPGRILGADGAMGPGRRQCP